MALGCNMTFLECFSSRQNGAERSKKFFSFSSCSGRRSTDSTSNNNYLSYSCYKQKNDISTQNIQYLDRLYFTGDTKFSLKQARSDQGIVSSCYDNSSENDPKLMILLSKISKVTSGINQICKERSLF